MPGGVAVHTTTVLCGLVTVQVTLPAGTKSTKQLAPETRPVVHEYVCGLGVAGVTVESAAVQVDAEPLPPSVEPVGHE